MIARCIENKVANPSYTVGDAYKITEEGMGFNFNMREPFTDTWYGQFSTDLKPALVPGTTFKRGGCTFVIEAGELDYPEDINLGQHK